MPSLFSFTFGQIGADDLCVKSLNVRAQDIWGDAHVLSTGTCATIASKGATEANGVVHLPLSMVVAGAVGPVAA